MVQLENVRKDYETFRFDVTLKILEGRITGLVGKNGAGKSTAIKLILGLTKRDGGTIRILERDVEDMTPKEKQDLGVALAEAGFSSQLMITDILKILEKMYDSFERDFFVEKCRELQLPMKKRIGEFSTGMRAMLKTLIAITHQAKLLILDEPTAGLDVDARNRVQDMLRSYMAEDSSRSILITSHIASDLERLCDDIYLIHEGKILLHEDVDNLLENYGVLKIDETQYEQLDKESVLQSRKESYGYACLVKDKQFYRENYPKIVIENGGIDELILMMTGGYR